MHTPNASPNPAAGPRRGAALIMALLLLTVLLLLGIPFLMSQKESYTGADTFSRGLEAEQHRSNTEALGIEMAHRLAMAQHNRSLTVGTMAYTAPVPDLNDVLFPGWDEDTLGLCYLTADTGEVHVDIPVIYEDTDPADGEIDRWPGSPYNAEMATGSKISIEDLSGRIDINALGPAQWHLLLQRVGIVDWDDDQMLDCEDLEDHDRFPTPTIDGDDGNDWGELAETLAEYRFSLPGNRYRNIEQLLEATPDHQHVSTSPADSLEYHPYVDGIGSPPSHSVHFGFRGALTKVELDRLRPYITVNGNAQARQGEIDLGSLVYLSGNYDFNPNLHDALSSAAAMELPPLIPNGSYFVNNHDSESPLLGDRHFGDLGEEFYHVWIFHDDAWKHVYPGPDDVFTLAERTPAIAIPVAQPICLNLARPPFPDETLDAGENHPGVDADINAKTQNQFLLARHHQAGTEPAYTPLLSNLTAFGQLSAAHNWFHERPAPALTSSYLYRLRTAGTSRNAAGEAVGQRRSTIYAQIPPQDVDLLQPFDSQAMMQWAIDRRLGNLITSWPQPVNRTTKARLAVGDPDPRADLLLDDSDDPRLRGLPLPAANRGSGSWRPYQGDPWERRFRGSQALDDLPDGGIAGIGSATVDDLTPDGLRLRGDKRMPYGVDNVLQPQLQPISTDPDDLEAQALEPLSISFSFTPRADLSGRTVLFDLRGPQSNMAPRFITGAADPVDNSWGRYFDTPAQVRELDLALDGWDTRQNRLTIEYDADSQFFIVTLADATVSAAGDYGPNIDQVVSAPLGGASVLSPGAGAGLGGSAEANGPQRLFRFQPLLNGEACYVQAEVDPSRPGEIRLYVDGLVGRDLGTDTMIRHFATTPSELIRPGDHWVYPMPLALNADLPEAIINRPSPRRSVDITAELQLAAFQALAFPPDRQTTAGTAPPLWPHAWLSGGGQQGTVRVGAEYIAFDSWTYGTTDSIITFENCVRARRQLPGNDAPGDHSSYRDLQAPSHTLGDMVHPGSISYRFGSPRQLYRGGGRLQARIPAASVSAIIATDLLPITDSTDGDTDVDLTVDSTAGFPEYGYARIDGTLTNASGTITRTNQHELVFFRVEDGNTFKLERYNDPSDLLRNHSSTWVTSLQWQTGATITLHSIWTTSPVTGLDDAGLTAFYDTFDHGYQVMDDSGTIEWLWYSHARARPEGLFFLHHAFDIAHSMVRGNFDTAPAAVDWPEGLPVIPIQRNGRFAHLQPGDRISLLARHPTGGDDIHQACVRHTYYRTWQQLGDHDNDATTPDTNETQRQSYTAFTEHLPADFGPITRVSMWPSWSIGAADDLSTPVVGSPTWRTPLWTEALCSGYARDDADGDDIPDDDRLFWFGSTDERPERGGSDTVAFEGTLDELVIARRKDHLPMRVLQVHDTSGPTVDPDTDGIAANDADSDVIGTAILQLADDRLSDNSGLVVIDGEVIAYQKTDAVANGLRIIGRGLLGSQPTDIGVGSTVRYVPIGPVSRIGHYTRSQYWPGRGYNDVDRNMVAAEDNAVQQLDTSYHWEIQLANGTRATDTGRAPCFLLIDPIGNATEIAQLIQRHNQYLVVAPWLRGLYNTDPLPMLTAPQHPDAETDIGAGQYIDLIDDYDPEEQPATLVIGWYPRYAPALPRDAAVSGVEAQLLRSRSFAWAGFPIRYNRCHFDTVDPPIDVEPDTSDEGALALSHFDAELRVLEAGYDWTTADLHTVTDPDDWDDAADAFGDLDDGRSTDGIEARIHWRYKDELATQMNTFGSFTDDHLKELLAATRNANRTPSVGPVVLRTRAPIVIFSKEEEH